MTILAPATDYSSPAATQGDKKTAYTNMHQFIQDLLGSDSSDLNAVRALLGVGGGFVQDFRLSLTSGLSVTTGDVSGATTVYASPHLGNWIDLNNGTEWKRFAASEFSLALGTLTSGKAYDLYANIASSVPALGISAAWNSDSSIFASGPYAAARPRVDGRVVMSTNGTAVDKTKLYMGSIYTTSTTTTEDSKTKRYLWNCFNRVPRVLQRYEPAASWTQAATATWRQANASSANQVGFLIGMPGDPVRADLNAMFTPNNGYKSAAALALNSITTPSGLFGPAGNSSSSSMTEMPLIAKYIGTPGLGLNYLAWLEWMQSSGFTTTWYGTNNTASYQTQCGILGEVMA